MHTTRRRFHRRTLLLTLLVALLAGACADVERTEAPDDPRLGELGMVRFVGGGCSGSTTMAIGSRVTLELEPVAGELPTDLSVGASDPAIVAAEASDDPRVITLSAHAEGESRVELSSGGALFDALWFQAEHATVARTTVARHVLAGGHLDVVVGEVYGACGTDACPLIGHSFLDWSGTTGASLLEDDEGTATFRVEGDAVHIAGVTDRPLVEADAEVVAPAAITGLSAILTTIPLSEDDTAVDVTLPGAVKAGSLFCVRIEGHGPDGLRVPISRRDVNWTVTGDEVVAIAMDHGSEPFGQVFVAGDSAGNVELEAAVPLTEMSGKYSLELTP